MQRSFMMDELVSGRSPGLADYDPEEFERTFIEKSAKFLANHTIEEMGEKYLLYYYTLPRSHKVVLLAMLGTPKLLIYQRMLFDAALRLGTDLEIIQAAIGFKPPRPEPEPEFTQPAVKPIFVIVDSDGNPMEPED